jgi:hypothetical protein
MLRCNVPLRVPGRFICAQRHAAALNVLATIRLRSMRTTSSKGSNLEAGRCSGSQTVSRVARL